MQRLAEEVLAGEHGPIGFTVNLAEGQSWSKILARRGLAETTRTRLVNAVQGIVAEALEKREMDMGAQIATIECDEIARLQAQLETAKEGELLLLCCCCCSAARSPPQHNPLIRPAHNPCAPPRTTLALHPTQTQPEVIRADRPPGPR